MINPRQVENAASAIGAIVLAAGASTRMGTPKQLLHFEGRSFLRQTVEVAIASVCKPIVVVLGAYAEKMRQEVNQLPVMVVENPQWHEGMGASIQVGMTALNAASEEIEGVVLTLCDQPFVSSDVINQLVAAYHSTGQGIIASEYAGTLGVPALFSRKFFSDLMNLQATSGAKQVIKKYSHEVFPVPFAAGAIDIDTPQDYEELQTRKD
ncbi:4-diphosphocytidyl-2C-methyl-D-erythritol synthase [Scytonema sp. HK-05]|uniref:nucleotidyltransferase family protein n=1 Tax=Scytonema sp. HK-05 TaxID=1137095 RepID=UPI0009364CDD|nr:nucleotidyltransferase family protein [Scytonema sp. HK-05]OKH60780.1 4-diphosphocytidyl-2C-methyl-D-erythritol synthase [Scytonema sp. HK-05]BAY45078.1 4-diphosphocytidyl-2C-methyl-D-erythritol synthase [Scytonema sp. HK-05]